MIQNIQCLISQKNKTKIDYISEQSKVESLDIIALTETWLREAIDDTEIKIPGYNVYRSDRKSEKNRNFPHGGVLLYIRESIIVNNISTFSNGVCKAIFADINSVKLSIFLVYRPPKTTLEQFREVMDFCRDRVQHLPSNQLIITMGDFNFPKDVIAWAKSEFGGTVATIKGEKSESSKSAEILLDFTTDLGMVQQVEKPTRDRNILDLLFVNDNAMINSTKVLKNRTISDHDCIIANTNIIKGCKKSITYENCSASPMNCYNFNKADWDKVRKTINEAKLVDKLSNENLTLDQKVELLYDEIINCCKSAGIPVKKGPPKHEIPRDRRILFRRRTKLLHKLEKYKNVTEKFMRFQEELDNINEQLDRSFTSQRLREEKEAVDQIKVNPKHLFCFCQEKK